MSRFYMMLFKNEFCNTTLAVLFSMKTSQKISRCRLEWERREGSVTNARSDIPSPTAKIMINDDVVACHLW